MGLIHTPAQNFYGAIFDVRIKSIQPNVPFQFLIEPNKSALS
jgi:hypothetical protein